MDSTVVFRKNSHLYAVMTGLLLLLLCFSATRSNAQRTRLDSLRYLIGITGNDSLAIGLHRQVAYMYLTTNVDSAFLHIDSAQFLAKQFRDTMSYARMFGYRGLACRLAGQYDRGLVQMDSADHYFKKWNDERNIAQGLFQRGVIYSLQGDLEKSMEMYMQELAINEKAGRMYGIANDHNSIGILYKKMDDCEKALSHFQKALSLFREMGRPLDEANALNGIGSCLMRQGEINQALPYFQQALAIDEDLGAEWGVGIQFQNIGQVHLALNELTKAKEASSRSMSILEKGGYEQELILSKIQYSEILTKLGQTDSAEYFVTSAKSMGNAIGALDLVATSYCQVAHLYASSHRYKEALEAERRCNHLRDSLVGAESIQRINELEIQYESVKKDQLLAENDLQLARSDAEIRKRNIWIGVAVGLGLLATLILLAKIRSNKQKRKLQQVQLEQLRAEKRVGYATAMINGQEAERGRIAKDLHDGLGAILATAKIQLGKVQEGIEALENMKVHEKASALIDTAYTEVRRISHDMMPASLEKFGLSKAMESLARMLNNQEMVASYNEINMGKRLPENVEIALYRIAQEAANNMLKYAKAKTFTIDLERAIDKVEMTITDDGIGFDAAALEHQGLGLENMRSRAGFLDGTVTVHSEKGEGTVINVMIPL